MSKRICKNSIITFLVISSYLLLLVLKKYTGLNLVFLPAILLLFWLPGKMILEFFPRVKDKFSSIGNLALEIFISFSTITSCQIVLSSRLSLKELVIFFVTLNLFMATFCLVFYFAKRRKKVAPDEKVGLGEAVRIDKLTLLTTIIPIVFIALMFYLDPAVKDNDGFLTSLQKLSTVGEVATIRPEFVRFLGLVSVFTNLSYILVFQAVFVVLFYFSTFFSLDYILRHTKDRRYVSLIYLTLLAAPVILIEANTIRPQVVMIAYTLPVLFLLVGGLEKRDPLLFLIAFWFSVISVSYHEISIGLVLAVLVAISYYLLLEIIQYKKKSLIYQIIIVLIIIFPYTQLASFNLYFGQSIKMAKYALDHFSGFHLRWWFIDNYTTVDGQNLGWPGVQAIYYYLYNGILFLLFGIPLSIIYRKSFVNKGKLFPVVIYVLIFLTFAEILPRVGFYFLLNRAWVHLLLGYYVIFAVVSSRFELRQYKYKNVLMFMLIGVILSGAVGIIYVTKNNVSDTFPEELASTKFMKRASSNSIFFSSQNNNTLVNILSDKEFYYLSIKNKFSDQSEFEETISDNLKVLAKDREVEINPEVIETITIYTNNVLTAQETKLVHPRKTELVQKVYNDGEPVYFIYSFRKTRSLNGTREWIKVGLDSQNVEFYQKLSYPIAYSDSAVIIYRLR